MGTSQFRSWSVSRERTFRECPRRFFFEYFPHGEPNANVLGVLKNAICLPMLVGTVVHEMIASTLGVFKATHREQSNLKAPARTIFNDALAASAKAAERINRGLSVPIGTRVLLHHLEKGSFEMRETVARESLAGYLDAFEGSTAWEWLRSTETKDWEPVKTETDRKETILASEKLGFQRSLGLKIYTPYDIAVKTPNEFVIIDWKAGSKSSVSVALANRQTASYALRALDKDISLESVRLAPFWLQCGEPWVPRQVDPAEIEDVVRAIEEHDAAELALLRERRLGVNSAEWHASKADFKPNVGRRCADCKYRKVCPEGREASQSGSGLQPDRFSGLTT